MGILTRAPLFHYFLSVSNSLLTRTHRVVVRDEVEHDAAACEERGELVRALRPIVHARDEDVLDHARVVARLVATLAAGMDGGSKN